MIPTLHDLGIDQLNTEERLQLISAIWDSLESPPEIPASHKMELDRRMSLSDADPSRNLPWKDVLSRLQSKRS
jgi:putative addiction module component (TIGR02574 family)